MIAFFSLVLGILFEIASAQDSFCHVQGQCDNALFLGAVVEDDYNLCLERCRITNRCEYVTYNGGLKDCLLFETCPNVTNFGCTTCYSSSKDCNEFFICNAPGFAQGLLEWYNRTDSREQCIQSCFEYENCQYWTHDANDGFCYLISNMTSIDNTCSNCWFGEKCCYAGCGQAPILEGENRLVVVSGDIARVVDMSGQILTCPNLPNLPIQVQYGVGMSFNNVPFICGSWLTGPQDECYELDQFNGTWNLRAEMIQGRYDAAAVRLDADRLWVTGGYQSGANELNSTEVVSISSNYEFQNSWMLPEAMDKHCLLKVNDSHYFIHEENGQTWMMNIETGHFEQLANIPVPRSYPICGLVRNQFGEVILVTGGQVEESFLDLTYAYSVSNSSWYDNAQWNLPLRMRGKAVQYGENSFLVLGGFDGNEYLNTIFEFNGDSFTWITRKEEIPISNFGLVAFMVDEAFVECT